jgi:phage host-nuclease inhibitor protein Gam
MPPQTPETRRTLLIERIQKVRTAMGGCIEESGDLTRDTDRLTTVFGDAQNALQAAVSALAAAVPVPQEAEEVAALQKEAAELREENQRLRVYWSIDQNAANERIADADAEIARLLKRNGK